MVKPVSANGLSAAVVAKAKRENRFVRGMVYPSVRDANAARNSGSKKTSGKKKPSPQKKSGPRRISEVLEFDAGFEVGLDDDGVLTSAHYVRLRLNGNDADDRIVALAARNPRVVGVRFNIKFPFETGAVGRWVVASARSISDGDKTVEQVASLRGAKHSVEVNAVDKWVDLGVQCPVAFDESGNSLTKEADLKAVAFAIRYAGFLETHVVRASFHVTVQLDAASPVGSSTVLEI